MSSKPISDYAFLSDCHSAALVSRAGSVDWLCFPRFDSPAVFARLLDEEAGHWSIAPVERADVSRHYLDGSLAMETTFTTAGGRATLTDALALGSKTRGHRLGAEAPHALLREIECVDGTLEIEIEFAPRPEYGLVTPILRLADGGVHARGSADVLLLSAEVPWTLANSTARARVVLERGGAVAFALVHRTSSEPAPDAWTARDIRRRLKDTVTAWQSWAEMHQRYDGPWKHAVHHSGRVLQGLTYYPTGALIAAPTTSLPEVVGGDRNWDYRYTWVRDASFTLEALWVAACPDEAHVYFDFLAAAASVPVRRGRDLQIMFGVGGEHDLTERHLPHLTGWRNSRPVRVGNEAWSQRQIDVYGELIAAAYVLREHISGMAAETRPFLVSIADAALARWEEQDQGIWEVRGEPQHFLHSKLMCWVALDRALAMVEELDAHEAVPRWEAAREAIRREILERGWSDKAGAFTQAFGSDALDASALVMPLVGFLPATDARVLSTIAAIRAGLLDARGLVYRYRGEDGLEGEEGTFLICTFWLAHALALAGLVAEATATFERALSFANDVGLLAEEVDTETGELLGNFPQAFSHIGLVNAAWAINLAQNGNAG
jgi:GH15 family glucan-1,4-alpha-glucosidase